MHVHIKSDFRAKSKQVLYRRQDSLHYCWPSEKFQSLRCSNQNWDISSQNKRKLQMLQILMKFQDPFTVCVPGKVLNSWASTKIYLTIDYLFAGNYLIISHRTWELSEPVGLHFNAFHSWNCSLVRDEYFLNTFLGVKYSKNFPSISKIWLGMDLRNGSRHGHDGNFKIRRRKTNAICCKWMKYMQ